MKTTKPIVLLALVLLTTAAVQPAEAMVKPKISNTRTASCLVKITSDPADLPLSDIVIDYLLHSSGVAGKAAREVLNISPDDAFQLFTIEDVAKYSAALPRSSRSTTAAARRATAVRARPSSPRPTTTATTTRTSPRPARTPTTPSRRPTTPAASTTSTDEQTYLLKLQVELGEEVLDEPIKPAAEEFMNALIDNFRSALSEAYEDYIRRLDNQRLLADKEADRAENKLVQMQSRLRDISGSRDLSRNVILQNISRLRNSIHTTKMQKATDQVDMDATTREIAVTKVKIREKVENDPIKNELQKIVDIHTKSLENIQKLVKEGAVSSTEVDNVLEKLARARIELAKRRQEISIAEGGNRLNQLSSKLADDTRQMAQYDLYLSSKEHQLAEAEELLARADDYELLSLKADIAKQSLQETLLWRERTARKARLLQPPAVTVLGAS